MCENVAPLEKPGIACAVQQIPRLFIAERHCSLSPFSTDGQAVLRDARDAFGS